MMDTQVGIVGAGPAGLLLSHLLDIEGVSSVVLERHSRDYIEHRVRAGVLEQGTVDVLLATGLGERLQREGLRHEGVELRFDGEGHRVDFPSHTGGRAITVYGQQEVIKDLVAARLAANGTILFEVEGVGVRGIETSQPSLRFTAAGEEVELHCDFVAGCDGFHGVCRPSIPAGVLTTFERSYPFAWLGILARAAPSTEELIYANHELGFALHSMRSPELSRNYIQCPPDDDIAEWSDDRIWDQLHRRLALRDVDFRLNEGPIVERGITPMRSFVVEPMQFGRLFLAGDAAHIVPPTGAKGMNLAVADVQILASALVDWYATGRSEPLEGYSTACLRRVWRAQHFSWWMTSMTHRFDDGHGDYRRRLQLAELAYVVSSPAATTTLAENYVGLPRV